ncbi:hypothetical protein [Serratia fonticola]|uniref:hypothetical protein n=1 Tax=Serratia fonticola TaxID=47917 RepID=UPI0021B70F46|nr:hypothetical protein [Serratia fonticola]
MVADVDVPFSSVKVVRPERWKMKYILLAGIVALLGLMAFQFIQWGYPSSMGYLARYTEKTTVSGCQVFTDHVVKNVEKVKENIELSQIDCNKNPYIYLTGFQYSQQLSLLSCDRPLGENAASTCYVNNIVRDNKK